ncbi:MAG: glycosyltransferase family 4 protein [Kangiellaceae bacterium]|nr:glycosyltransferase family 4 protein [Kangiellaceae bacterium]
MTFIVLALLSLVMSLILTKCLQIYTLKKNIIDVPNKRSSHSVPTPRGGGMSIVITFIIGILACFVLEFITAEFTLLIVGAGLITAVIGFMDDHSHVKAGVRLMCHFISSILVVYAVNGLPALTVFEMSIEFQYLGWLIAVLASVWILNLFNFMDGIDGIAGVEAVSSTIVMGAICHYFFSAPNVALLHFLLGLSSLGFLFFNFPPAKIFMGDAGSGFLGLMLAMLLLLSSHISEPLFWCWLIMLGVFIVDATFTLLRRMINGFKLHEAHCSHAYQFASRKYGGHLPVTLAVLLINILWLAPISILVALDSITGIVGLLIAYTPLIFFAFRYNAGKSEEVTNA